MKKQKDPNLESESDTSEEIPPSDEDGNLVEEAHKEKAAKRKSKEAAEKKEQKSEEKDLKGGARAQGSGERKEEGGEGSQ